MSERAQELGWGAWNLDVSFRRLRRVYFQEYHHHGGKFGGEVSLPKFEFRGSRKFIQVSKLIGM